MLSRRAFLLLLTRLSLGVSGLLGLAGVLRFLSYKPAPPPPRRYDAGPETNFPIGSRTVLPDVPAVLIHSPDGFSAISMTCTHLGCTLSYQLEAFTCQCHGSRFDKNGRVTHGPAVEPLPALAVERTADGRLAILKD